MPFGSVYYIVHIPCVILIFRGRVKLGLLAGPEVFIKKVGDLLKGKKREMGQSKAGRLARKKSFCPCGESSAKKRISDYAFGYEFDY